MVGMCLKIHVRKLYTYPHKNTQSHALYPIYERLVLLYSSKNLFFDDPRRICLIVRARIKPIFEGSMFEPFQPFQSFNLLRHRVAKKSKIL